MEKYQNGDLENKAGEVNPEILLELTSEVVSAFVGNNHLSQSELPDLISMVHNSLSQVGNKGKEVLATDAKPAVPVKKSITDDYIICLEDGKKFKSLKRHLRSHYDMSPEEYREKWGLPSDYPMVAPNYAKARSALARKMGLGRKPGTRIKR